MADVRGLADGFLAGFNTMDNALQRREESELRRFMLDQQQKNADRNYDMAVNTQNWQKSTDERDYNNRVQQQKIEQENKVQDLALDKRRVDISAGSLAVSQASEKRQQRQQQLQEMTTRYGNLVEGITLSARAGDKDSATRLWSQLPPDAQQFYTALNPDFLTNTSAAQSALYLKSRAPALMSGQINPDDPKVIAATNSILQPELAIRPGELADDGKPMKSRELTHIMPDPRGGDNFYFGVTVTREDGSTYQAPITRNRSTDPNDPPLPVSSEQIMRTLAQRSHLLGMAHPNLEDADPYTEPDPNAPFMPVQDYMQVPQHIRIQQVTAGKTPADIVNDYNASGMERQKYLNEVKKQQQTSTDGKLQRQDVIETYDQQIKTIDGLLTDPGFSTSVGAGLGMVTKHIPGTDAASWDTRFKQFGGQNFLSAIQALRGMGALSNAEGEQARIAVSGLSASQSEEEFIRRASELKTFLTDKRDRYAAAYGMKTTQGQGELKTFGSKPFSSERVANASKWGKMPGATVEKVEGGYAVRLPPAGGQPQPTVQSQPDAVAATGAPAQPNNPMIPQAAIDMLRQRPDTAHLFDQSFGEGASQHYLGGQPSPKDEGLIGGGQPEPAPEVTQYAQSMKKSPQQPIPATVEPTLQERIMTQARQAGIHPEMGAAREFSTVDWNLMKSNLKHLRPEQQQQIAQQIANKFGGSTRQDEQGRLFVTVPSGEYLLNGDGMTREAVEGFASTLQPQPASVAAPAEEENPYAQFVTSASPQGMQATSNEENPYAQFVQQTPESRSLLQEGLLGVSEAGGAIAQAGVNVANIIPMAGDAVQSAAAYVGKEFMGIGDGTYTPAARFSLPESMRPQTEAGQVAADVLPYLINPASRAPAAVGKLSEQAALAAQRLGLSPQSANIAERGANFAARMAGESAVGSVAENSDHQNLEQGTDEMLRDLATNAAIGGAVNTAGKAIGAGYRAVKGTIAPEAQAAIDYAKQNNAPLMTSDMMPPQTFVGRSIQANAEKIPAVGTGQMRADQQMARSRLVDEFSQRYGVYSATDVVQSIKGQNTALKRAAGDRFNEIRNKMDSVGNVQPQRAIDAIDREITQLSRLGKTSDEATISRLKDYRDELAGGNVNFSLLDDLRTQFRMDVKGERMAMPDRSTVSVNRVYEAMTKDLNSAVNGALGEREAFRWAHAKAVYAQEADKVKGTKLKGILEKGHITPESVNSMLFDSRKSQIEALYGSLNNKGRQAARAGLIAKALEGEASPDRFLLRLNKYSANTGIFFKGEERQYLTGLQRYLESTQRASQASVTLPNGQVVAQAGSVMGPGLAGVFGGPVLAAKVIGTMGTYGAVGRIYESQPVRNALLRLANTPKGSTVFERNLEAVNRAITATAQGMVE
ncbi:hypothetical protein [Pectobacterium brasiliense]|uniref:hypothetical protein n=1 Tax=Pectobacterium brasiliense TaxID=180957 RepID=UPI0025A2D740|nr:hypothetical protein [Pectobacterium brasiliense]WJM82888.1 hypothetical protein QTI90_09140 [Pectobacterium brasiliense]